MLLYLRRCGALFTGAFLFKCGRRTTVRSGSPSHAAAVGEEVVVVLAAEAAEEEAAAAAAEEGRGSMRQQQGHGAGHVSYAAVPRVAALGAARAKNLRPGGTWGLAPVERKKTQTRERGRGGGVIEVVGWWWW